jgi:hypothetical protein
MPAIQIDRLKAQIQSILEPKFSAEIFLVSLRSLMEAHANLAFRSDIKSQRNHDLENYHLSPVILNQLQSHFILFTKENPDLAITYADLLWDEPFIEMKQFAGILLGALPEEKIPEIRERIVKWNNSTKDKALRTIIFNDCTKTIRLHGLDKWLEIIKSWMDSGNPFLILTGIQSIQILLQDPKFDNIPFVFNAISSITLLHQEKIANAVSELLQNLLIRNSIETTFFIKSLLVSQPSQELFRIIRRNLDFFSEEQQSKIRQLMKP